MLHHLPLFPKLHPEYLLEGLAHFKVMMAMLENSLFTVSHWRRVCIHDHSKYSSCSYIFNLFSSSNLSFIYSTCFNRIDLPIYEEKSELEEKLKIAITMAATGFDME